MSAIALDFDGVWKKFRRGEHHDSLRDLIPSFFGKRSAENARTGLDREEFWALKDVSFQVAPGEALGIIGPNGSGKSTSLKILSGILRPTQGRRKVKGRLAALIEVGAGFHPDLTGRENIYLNGAIMGMKRKDIATKLDAIVDFSGISEFIDTPVKRYSSGMYARLGFAIAAHVEPEVLLVDEVLSVGDVWFQERCINKMRAIAKTHTAVIFVSHNLQAVNDLCKTAAYLKHGSLVALGKTSDVIKAFVCSNTSEPASPDLANAIVQVRLADEHGAAADLFKAGDKARISFNLKCSRPFSECQVGFVINRLSDNLAICDYNLPLEALRRQGPDDVTTGHIDFDVALLRGAYSITLHVYHHPTTSFLSYAKNVAFFSVDEKLSFDGVCHVSPRLHP